MNSRNNSYGEHSRGSRARGRGAKTRGHPPPSTGSNNNHYSYIPKTPYDGSPFCYELAGYNLSVTVDDDTVSSTLYNKFAAFGKCKVGIEGEGKDRVAVIGFKNVEDAKEARRVLQGTIVFDRKLFIKSYQKFREEQEIYGDSETRAYNKYNNREPGSRIPRSESRSEPRSRDTTLPEDDPKATRTLFVGNLDYNFPESKLQSLFEKYGKVTDVEVKKQKDGFSSYAFVKYSDVQDAARAKDELNGFCTGKNVLKIGYGKGVMSHRIWVGGLGSWTKLAELEHEFDRFGKITKLEYNEGDYHAYVMYETLDAANAALSQMKGYPLGGPEYRITVDYSDPGSPNTTRKHRFTSPDIEATGTERNGNKPPSPKKKAVATKKEPVVESLSELCKRYFVAWKGSIVLKSNAFSVKLYLVGGDPGVAEKLLRNSSLGTIIRITQRLKLEKPKLEQLNQKLAAAGASGHCILVAMTTSISQELPDDITHRPLKHLLQYFIQKQAAGISAIGNDGDDTHGVLHTFPPCEFAQAKLLKAAPTLNPEATKEDYLVMILVKES